MPHTSNKCSAPENEGYWVRCIASDTNAVTVRPGAHACRNCLAGKVAGLVSADWPCTERQIARTNSGRSATGLVLAAVTLIRERRDWSVPSACRADGH